MNIADSYTADLRGAILLLLTGHGAECSVAVLRKSIEDNTLHSPSMDQLRMELVWLEERGLVTMRKIDGFIEGAIITESGQDVAGERKSVSGVLIPED